MNNLVSIIMSAYNAEESLDSSIESILNIAKRGGMFILVDDEKRENEGDLIISTSDTNAKNINFMA